MNIGIDISPVLTPHRTGVAEYTFEFLDALFRESAEHQYFLFYNGLFDVSKFIPPEWKGNNIHLVFTRYPNKFFHASLLLFGWPKINRLVERKIFTKTGESVRLDYFFSPNIGFTRVSDSCRHILTVHDLSFELFPECLSVKRKLWHRFLSPKRQSLRAHHILVPSENTKQDVVRIYGVDASRISVLAFGIFASGQPETIIKQQGKIQKKYQLPKKYILFLGTMEPRKNIESAIEGFRLSKLGKKGYELIIAGSRGWKNKKIFRMIDQTEGVRYIGYVLNEEKPALYRGATVFVYPSLYEGFGFPVLEAMAMGTPVITSNRSSLPEVAGGAAYLVDPHNAQEIADGLKRMVKDPSVSQFFIQKGLQHIQTFEWKKSAEHFLESL